jgi:hypothetical protein
MSVSVGLPTEREELELRTSYKVKLPKISGFNLKRQYYPRSQNYSKIVTNSD